jgi:hypothetical protein
MPTWLDKLLLLLLLQILLPVLLASFDPGLQALHVCMHFAVLDQQVSHAKDRVSPQQALSKDASAQLSQGQHQARGCRLPPKPLCAARDRLHVANP